jgi:hypothetical protein
LIEIIFSHCSCDSRSTVPHADVHDEVHAGVIGMDALGERRDLVKVRDIQHPILGDLGTERASVVHRLRQAVGVAVSQVELGAVAGEP